jgi:LmeA-like phospholipid-binding
MRRLVIALLVLIGLLIVADFGAAALAESAVSRQMRSQLQLADDPSVRINGFPFLTQAVSGEYGSVDVGAQRLSVGPLREVGLRAQLRNVTAPLSMLLGTGPKTLQVQAAEGTLRIPSNDVQRLVPGVEKLRVEAIDDAALQQAIDDGGDVSLGDLDPDLAVRFVGSSALLGQQSEVAVIAALELTGGQLRIVPRDIRVASAPRLPAPVQQALQKLFTLRIDPGSLPLDITPTKVRVADDALEITGRARDLTLGDTATVTGG